MMSREPRSGFLVDAGLLALLCAPLFLFQLGRGDVAGPMEPLAWTSAREMWQRGDAILPTFNGRPRLQKPPLPLWGALLAATLKGRMDPLAARLPAVLLALLTLFITLSCGRSLWGREAGLAAALFLGVSVGFVDKARVATWDMPLAACVTAAMACLVRALFGPRPNHLAGLGFFAALGVGLLAKGPVVLAFVCPALFLHLLWLGQLSMLKRLPWMRGLLLLSLIALPWPLLVIQRVGADQALRLWTTEAFSRPFSGYTWRWAELLYYLKLPGLLFPASLLSLLGLAALLRPRGRLARSFHMPPPSPAASLMVSWLLWGLLLLSLASLKRGRYALPLLPPLALLAGAIWSRLRPERKRDRQLVWAQGLSMLAGWGVMLLYLLGSRRLIPQSGASPDGARRLAVAAACVGGVAGLLLPLLFRKGLAPRRALIAALGLHVAAGLLLTAPLARGSARKVCNPWRAPFQAISQVWEPGDRLEVLLAPGQGLKAAFFAYAPSKVAVWRPARKGLLAPRTTSHKLFLFCTPQVWRRFQPAGAFKPFPYRSARCGREPWLVMVEEHGSTRKAQSPRGK